MKAEQNDQNFHAGEVAAQRRWNTGDIWDAVRRQRLLWKHIPAEFHARLESAPFFFLATCDDTGRCDCSFKGGGPGLVRVLDERRFAFPDFDGNGAFMSLGNLLRNPQVGCLFIDFTDGARLRINGAASIHETGEFAELFPGAARVVLVEVEQVVPNCSRHIPRLGFVDSNQVATR
ncbi:MAG: pyridoxamine 5'-phosphate oxidase family protein [Gammaproteobacteria bacterium]|nr:pyridoxamine 5'-phosphate oxidase family protein [Gammaproteobacteria bacterium]